MIGMKIRRVGRKKSIVDRLSIGRTSGIHQ